MGTVLFADLRATFFISSDPADPDRNPAGSDPAFRLFGGVSRLFRAILIFGDFHTHVLTHADVGQSSPF